MNIYQQQILDNFHNPYHSGRPEQFTNSFKLSNLSCGDEIEVFLNITEGKVTDIHYEARGCAISIASASLLAQSLEGKGIDELRDMPEADLLALVGIELTPNRKKCALLPLQALQNASLAD